MGFDLAGYSCLSRSGSGRTVSSSFGIRFVPMNLVRVMFGSVLRDVALACDVAAEGGVRHGCVRRSWLGAYDSPRSSTETAMRRNTCGCLSAADRARGGHAGIAMIDHLAKAEPTGERFVPEDMGGGLIEAEHQARYRLALPHVAGRTVLDAGCGVGWGSDLLLDAGAREVTGLDLSPDAIASARSRNSGVTYLTGDLLEMPFAGEVSMWSSVSRHWNTPPTPPRLWTNSSACCGPAGCSSSPRPIRPRIPRETRSTCTNSRRRNSSTKWAVG